MAKEISSADSSLPLHEVLESEFVALHGELPADYPKSTESETRLKAFCAAVHGLKEKRAALCISGGGIRSATFGLGILQGLARCGLLDKFHYLSTVSGGGYIGSWLSAWIKNDPNGIRGVITELRRRPESTLEPEPQPICHLREFSNYLAPKTGLTSVDFWTLIATFIRNMFLNWLVLISLLAAAMMIPRFYLAAINLQPDWSSLTTFHWWELWSGKGSHLDWKDWTEFVMARWDIGLAILLAVGFALIATAMAYAIVDVPSTGNARYPQRRFLIFRQLPLFLASLTLPEWWALFRNVHGNEPFRPSDWLGKFIAFMVASYLSGELIAAVFPSFRKHEQKVWPDRVLRFVVIVAAAAFAGLCLWAMATHLFLQPKEIEFKRDYKATDVSGSQKLAIQQGTKGFIKEIVEGSDTIATKDQRLARIAERDLDALEVDGFDSKTGDQKFTLKRAGGCDVIQIPTGRKTKIRDRTPGLITEVVGGSFVITTDQGRARVEEKDIDALEPKFKLVRDCAAVEISSGDKNIPLGTEGLIKGFDEPSHSYIVEIVQRPVPRQAHIAEKDLDAFQLNPVPAPANDAVNYACFAPALFMAVIMLVNFLNAGLASWVTQDEDREWWGRSAAWILITVCGWIVVNSIVLWGAQAISGSPTGNAFDVFIGKGGVKASSAANTILGSLGGVTGVVGALLALRSKLSKRLGVKLGSQWPLIIAAVVFFVLLAIVISWTLLLIGSQPWVDELAVFLAQPTAKAILGALGGAALVVAVLLALRSKLSRRLGQPVGSQWPAIIAAVLSVPVITSWILLLISGQSYVRPLSVISLLTSITLIVGIALGFFINANKFSLHATYRNRLIRAYLAASRATRSPNRFTGFDPDDNFKLYKLPSEKPLHLINGTLNLVKGEQLAWQERKAESFSMSRLHCGSLHVGYRLSAKYGKGITLGTAFAISGAAANPNMGYHSSPVVGFLMTLFNVRLGWWLGNPGPAGAKTWRRSGPRYSVGPLFSEALGRTTDRYKYVNLSDGGHFENLGLYEMVLRRCHYIVVSDAGEDPECSFADLGEAVRKIRIDFGIPIEFGPMSIYPRSQLDTLKNAGHNCAIGRIRYSAVDGDSAPDGVLIYIKPVCYGDEPRDIYEYFKTNPTFPHETTADQFFSESQFESYRMLGAYTIEKMCTDCSGDFRAFIREILKRHLKMKAPDWLVRVL